MFYEVLLADAQTDGVTLLGGRVILHHADKRQFALIGRDLVKQYTNVRHYYTGERPAHQKHIGIHYPNLPPQYFR